MNDHSAPSSIEPLLSILMVNWNTRELTLACLRSVYEQTSRTPFEIILVDNNSADGSADAIMRAFPQVHLILEPRNNGFAQGNNIAARRARGRYLLLLNTDTVVLDGAIDRIVACADRTPEARIWGGRTIFADGSINPTFCWGRITPWSSFCYAAGLTNLARRSRLFNPEGASYHVEATERNVDVISGCFFLIGADLWRRLGGFDPLFFMYGEEADLCARARRQGSRPLVIPAATIVHYGGASAAKGAGTIVYVLGARTALSRKHLGPLAARFSRAMILLTAFLRAKLYGLVSRFSGRDKYRTSAELWAEAWGRRAEWKDGPQPPGR